MTIADGIRESIEKSSWIRKMFEEGARLKAEFGEENVFDFSLGNPDLDPPVEFINKMRSLTSADIKNVHGYMENAGLPEARKAIAEKVSRDHGADMEPGNIIMTCGAAGGLNVVLKAILNPGDEVIVIKPYFVEYGFYISNHNGTMVLVETNEDFSLNIDAISRAITPKTKAVLINSPNNPTGKIYSAAEIDALSSILREKSGSGGAIYLISDEPYREIVFDNVEVPSILNHYNESVIVTSYSKSLSIPGERIGYIAVNPSCSGIDTLMAGMIVCNRILGYVNAPAFMQRVVSGMNNVTVDVDAYKRRRDLFVQGLEDAGYDFPRPEGAFYIFCKSPVEDDVEFVRHLQNYNILVVPGVGFGGPGYFRIAYCVSEDIISRSLPKFREALETFR